MADAPDDSRQTARRTMWAAIVAAVFGIVAITGLVVGIIALVVG